MMRLPERKYALFHKQTKIQKYAAQIENLPFEIQTKKRFQKAVQLIMLPHGRKQECGHQIQSILHQLMFLFDDNCSECAH